MNIVFDQKLLDYMTKKGYSAIRMKTIDPVGCCADSSELLVDFVKQQDEEAIQESAVRVLENPQANIYLLTRGLEVDETIHLSLKSFLGMKDIHVEGIRAWSF